MGPGRRVAGLEHHPIPVGRERRPRRAGAEGPRPGVPGGRRPGRGGNSRPASRGAAARGRLPAGPGQPAPRPRRAPAGAGAVPRGTQGAARRARPARHHASRSRRRPHPARDRAHHAGVEVDAAPGHASLRRRPAASGSVPPHGAGADDRGGAEGGRPGDALAACLPPGPRAAGAAGQVVTDHRRERAGVDPVPWTRKR